MTLFLDYWSTTFCKLDEYLLMLRCILSSSNGSGESDTASGVVEMGVEGLEEAVSDNEGLSELRGKVESYNTNNAGWFSSLINFKNVVLSSKSILITSDDEIKSGEIGDLSAINLFLFSSSKGFSHILNDLSGSNNQWCSSINNTNKIRWNFIAGSVEDDIIKGDSPVVLHFKGIVFEWASVIFVIDASED